MKLTNGNMWESIQILTKVNETGKLGYACARNLRKLIDANKEYMEIRDKLLAKYGKPEGQGRYSFEPEQAQKFMEELQEYSNIEHDVDVFQVDEDIFYSGNLTTKEMYILAWMAAV